MTKPTLKNHLAGPRCEALTMSRVLLARGLRPFPPGNSLPEFIPLEVHMTMVAYEGEPREDKRYITGDPRQQFWAPLWVDIVVELWSGRIGASNISRDECDRRSNERDAVLYKLNSEPTLAQALETCWRLEGMSGARGCLKPYIRAPMPENPWAEDAR